MCEQPVCEVVAGPAHSSVNFRGATVAWRNALDILVEGKGHAGLGNGKRM